MRSASSSGRDETLELRARSSLLVLFVGSAGGCGTATADVITTAREPDRMVTRTCQVRPARTTIAGPAGRPVDVAVVRELDGGAFRKIGLIRVSDCRQPSGDRFAVVASLRRDASAGEQVGAVS